MRDYADLVKALREHSKMEGCACDSCQFYDADERGYKTCSEEMAKYAADAIEELVAAMRSVVHCKDCEWWTKQEASIQGRCARLAIYPTGEFYCASGSKGEPPKGVE